MPAIIRRGSLATIDFRKQPKIVRLVQRVIFGIENTGEL